MTSSPQKQAPVLVYYYLPEDKDDVDVPNAFPVLGLGGALRLQDIKAKFPLPGKYHFRFKMVYGAGDAAIVLWMDTTNDAMQVPSYEGKIIAKVTRIAWDPKDVGKNNTEPSQPATAAPLDAASRQSRASTAPAAAAAAPPPPPQMTAQDSLLFDDAPVSQMARASSVDMLQVDSSSILDDPFAPTASMPQTTSPIRPNTMAKKPTDDLGDLFG